MSWNVKTWQEMLRSVLKILKIVHMSVLKADNINNCQKMSINVKKLPEISRHNPGM